MGVVSAGAVCYRCKNERCMVNTDQLIVVYARNPGHVRPQLL